MISYDRRPAERRKTKIYITNKAFTKWIWFLILAAFARSVMHIYNKV